MTNSTQVTPTAPSFESRIWRQSRLSHIDQLGNPVYEHNSYLEAGEMVELATGGPAAPILGSPYRDLISRQEFVDVLVTLPDGRQVPRRFLVSAARRAGKGALAPPKSY